MYQASHNDYPITNYDNADYLNYAASNNYWNLDAASLNPSLNNLQSSQNNLYHSSLNRSYDLNVRNSHHINTTAANNGNQSYNQFYRDFTGHNIHNNNNNNNANIPGYILNQNFNKRYSNFEYHLIDYTYANLNIHNLYNNSFRNMPNKSEKANNRNYKVYLSDSKNKSDTDTEGATSSADNEANDSLELDSDYDTLEEYNKLFSKELNKETVKRLERNNNCLSMMIEGDIIEYVSNEAALDDAEHLHYWAVYMGNSMIMRFDVNRRLVIYESYWKIANENCIFINRDLDKRLITLPIYETLYRARNAHSTRNMSKKFSSDKNFTMWCRFDINKSDIDFATDKGNYSSKQAKEFLIEKFLDSLSQAKELLDSKGEKRKSKADNPLESQQ